MHPREDYLRCTGRTTTMINSIYPHTTNIYIVIRRSYLQDYIIGLLRKREYGLAILAKVKIITPGQFSYISQGLSPLTTAFYFDHSVLDGEETDEEFWQAFREWGRIVRSQAIIAA